MADWTLVQEAAEEGGFAVLVTFGAAWCKPCKAIAPFVQELSARFAGSILFVKVDVDECEAVAEQANAFRGLPLFQLRSKGEAVDELIGARQEKLVTMLEKFVGKND
uniref:Thioredoxin n=1 Tax=Eutreptiella gymnastica TaxID=73025 RepID=A0A7S1I797_9EUGL